MEQVIAAIDEIKGGKDWRSGTEAGKGKALKTTFLENLVGLYCIVPRDNYLTLISCHRKINNIHLSAERM